MTSDIPLHIDSLHQAYGRGTRVNEVLQQCHQRLQDANDPGIFLTLSSEAQIAEQLASLGPFDPDLKPLWGVPYAVKDNIDVLGLPTSAACPAFSYQPEKDAHVVTILRDAGAICLGKTNMDQFATGLTGVRTPHSIPRNPIDDSLIPGGSSSGSAVAVALGIVAFALGTDTAGSGRVPAALNNIVGIKPSLGALSNSGVVPACRSLDSVSIFSLSVLDGNKVRALLSRYDESDPFSRPMGQSWQPSSLVPSPIRRIAIPNDESIRFYDDSVQAAAFKQSVATISELGITSQGIDFTLFFQVAELLYEGAWLAERYVAVGGFIESQPAQIHPITHAIISKARDYKATDAFKDQYQLQILKRRIDALLEDVDVICVPSIPRLFTLQEVKQDPIGPNSVLGTYTNFANLLDLCAVTLPTQRREDGLPGSITLLTRAGGDLPLATLSWRLQRSFAGLNLAGMSMEEKSLEEKSLVSESMTTNTHSRSPLNNWPGNSGFSLADISEPSLDLSSELSSDTSTDQPSDSDRFIELAVCGAHMKGLPLNGQLTELGAEFVKSGQTSKDYQFYKLAGGPPFRPGLIHCIGQGDSIELEVWRLPKHRFAEFIAKVPAPLGIGTVTLDNGELVKGFICEGYAAATAEEITHYRSWRKFMASV